MNLSKLLPYCSKTHSQGTWYSLRKEAALWSQLVQLALSAFFSLFLLLASTGFHLLVPEHLVRIVSNPGWYWAAFLLTLPCLWQSFTRSRSGRQESNVPQKTQLEIASSCCPDSHSETQGLLRCLVHPFCIALVVRGNRILFPSFLLQILLSYYSAPRLAPSQGEQVWHCCVTHCSVWGAEWRSGWRREVNLQTIHNHLPTTLEPPAGHLAGCRSSLSIEAGNLDLYKTRLLKVWGEWTVSSLKLKPCTGSFCCSHHESLVYAL